MMRIQVNAAAEMFKINLLERIGSESDSEVPGLLTLNNESRVSIPNTKYDVIHALA